MVAWLAIAGAPGARASSDVGPVLRRLVDEGTHPWLRRPSFADHQAAVRAVYEAKDGAPCWLDDGRPSSAAVAMTVSFAAAGTRGLRAADYDAERLGAEVMRLRAGPEPTAEDAGLFDVALTVAVVRFVSDAYLGRVAPRDVGFGLDLPPKELDVPKVVEALADDDEPEERLAKLDPALPLFARLVAAIGQMRTLADRRDLPALPDLPTLRAGDRHPGVPAVRQWLVALGDAPAGDPSAKDVTRYDAGLAASVRRFQERHGRKADGVLGKTTLSDLRVPPARRAAQIELAMERLRWLPAQSADRFIVVNVPEFRLRAFDRGTEHPPLTMEVVVGKAARRTETPIMQADMKAVVFRPFWRVPPEIVKKEILPKAEEEPDYLERQHMEVLDGGRVRQRPGPDNALGLVKFLLPSPYHVYLHDTPAKQLFSRSRRDFSHGCIRVADAVALAEFVLQGTWDRERIVEAMERGPDSTRVELPAPVPVYLLYTTVVVEPDGRAFFFDDIYGHDARLAERLAIR